MTIMRRTQSHCAALLALALLAPFISAQEISKGRSDDPIVRAVHKSIAGVVAIRIERKGEKDMVGSGFIFDQKGYIITNRHVTAGKRYVKVKLHDGEDLDGEVVVADADQDLAVVRVKTKTQLKELELLGKDDLMLAEKVIAIGSPYGYDHTVSVGIISALNRKLVMPNEYLMTRLIQHNAAINPGNSGGPLVNINAEVIGINVAMRDGAQNIAFAIHAHTVKEFLAKNFNAQRVAGIEHGIRCEEKLVAEVGDRQRVVVKNAAHEELKAGDEIITLGHLKLANTFDLERALWDTRPGQKVEARVMREGREVAVTLTFAASHGAGSVAAATNVRSTER
jgi:serine protease Do